MTTKSRLNMKHGFMQSIIKNQVDRDNYDKEVKSNGGKKVVSPSQATATKAKKKKKPDLHTYAPPMVRQSQEDCRNNGQSEENAYLFTFEYEDENGQLFHLVVNRGDDVDSLANRFGEERSLDHSLVDALQHLLNEEMKKRTVSSPMKGS